MTLQELIAKVPAPLQPVAQQYGPALLAMSAEQFWAWVGLVQKGAVVEAYRVLVESLSTPELLNEWQQLNTDWQAENEANAAKIELQKAALVAVLKAVLTIGLGVVGL